MTHWKTILASCLVVSLSLGVGCRKKAEERPLPEGGKPTGGAAEPAVTPPKAKPTTKAATQPAPTGLRPRVGYTSKSWKTVTYFAPPWNKFGPAIVVYEVFGERVGCRITVQENYAGGVIRLKVRKNGGNNGEKWREYMEGTWISAQVVEVRAASTAQAGTIILKIRW